MNANCRECTFCGGTPNHLLTKTWTNNMYDDDWGDVGDDADSEYYEKIFGGPEDKEACDDPAIDVDDPKSDSKLVFSNHIKADSASICTEVDSLDGSCSADRRAQYVVKDNLENPRYALIEALRDHDLTTAERLLEPLVNVNYVDARGTTALMIAAYRGYASLCEKLLVKGADVLYYTKDFINDEVEYDDILKRAKCSHDLETINLIEKATVRALWARAKENRKRDPAAFKDTGWHCLENGARLGMTDFCAEIIIEGINPNPLSRTIGNELLENALNAGHLQTCVVLVALGANPECLSWADQLPRELAKALQTVGKVLHNHDAANS